MSSVDAFRAHYSDRVGYPPPPDASAWKPHVLTSYTRPQECAEVIDTRSHYGVAILDSGAFSAYTVGKEVDLAAYLEYIKAHPQWDHAIQLDVIGNPEATLGNYLKMLRAGVRPMPVFQYRAPAEQLPIFAETTDYIAVSVTAQNLRSARRPNMLKHILGQLPSGMKAHLLGIGTPARMVRELRPQSGDTTSVNVAINQFGDWVLTKAGGEYKRIDRRRLRAIMPKRRREIVQTLRYVNVPPARWTWDAAMRLEVSYRVAIKHYYDLEAATGFRHHFATSDEYFYERLLHAAHLLREEGLLG